MPASFVSPSFVLAFCLCCATLLTTGCGMRDTASADLVAKVDGESISQNQMKAALARAQGITPENIATAKQDILMGLVEQQLAVNLAISKKLDRRPDVQSAIEDSRREILARAALDQIAFDLPQASEDESQKYYRDNPSLFVQRRIFTVQEVVLKKSVEEIDAIRAQIASGRHMEDMMTWLRDKNVPFTTSVSTRPAEQIAPDALRKLQTFKDGQIGLLESSNAFTITQLLASHAQPISGAKGLSAAAVFLNNLRGAEAVKQARLDMKARAKLEYFGEFAGSEAAFKARSEAEAKAAAAKESNSNNQSLAEGEALAAQLEKQEAEKTARDKARVLSGTWQAPSRAEAIIVEQGIKGL